MAVSSDPNGAHLIAVDSGEVVEVIRPAQLSGLVEVQVSGRHMSMFLTDLTERGEALEADTAG